LVVNFAALGIGGLFTGDGVASEWYQGLNKAPWTPPGWVFGAAWTAIMVCLTFYMAFLWTYKEKRKLILSLFIVQWVLNVGWNPIFFYHHDALSGLIVIVLLTVLVGFFMFYFMKRLRYKSLLIAPYFIWLLIATSLNAYILFNN
jgi:tryptophan-rich sensory protein